MDEKKKSYLIEPTTPFRHSLPLQLRFSDIDALGHLNNAMYFNLYDLGKAKYLTAVRGEEVDWNKANIVVANVNCNFLRPVYFDEHIAVQTQMLSLQERSFKLLQQIVNIDTGEIKSQCTTVMVGFDVAAACSAPISPEWHDMLCAYEGRDLK